MVVAVDGGGGGGSGSVGGVQSYRRDDDDGVASAAAAHAYDYDVDDDGGDGADDGCCVLGIQVALTRNSHAVIQGEREVGSVESSNPKLLKQLLS